jgi:predicted amidohydrolase YtcJ
LTIKFFGAKFLDLAGNITDELYVSGGLVTEAGSFEHQVDLNGGFVLPAFRDGHAHPIFAGREADGPDVSKATSVEEIQTILKEYRQANPNKAWIEGGAYDRSLLADGRFLAIWLDEVVSDVPVVLHASDHHTIWVNTLALELIGLPLPMVSTGSIDQSDAGIPTGVLREPEAMALVMDRVPARKLADEVSALLWADRKLASFGIVEAQDAWITPGMTEIYIEAARNHGLLLDYNLAFKIEPTHWEKSLEFAIADRAKLGEIDEIPVTAHTVKFFADGVFGSGTAAVLEPYIDDASSFGEPLWDENELKSACLKAQKAGFQLHIHAIGDAGVRQSLDAIEFAQASLGPPKLPNVIAHAELISESDLPRFAALNVVANMQPLWAQADGMLMSCQPRLGTARLDSLYRMRDLIDSGALIAFGSDWPVSSPDPILGISTAVTRQTDRGEPEGGWTLEQATTISEALSAYSQAVTHQLRADGRPGLANDTPADFVVLDRNILTTAHDELRDIKVIATFKRGVQIYKNQIS